MPRYRLIVNEREHTVETQAERPLLDVIREDLKLTGTKYGCGEGQCRACTVMLDGRPVVSCVTPVRSADGKKIITIEGLGESGQLHRVQQAFLDEGAFQCGYCTPGMILRAVALLQAHPKPTDTQIVEAMNGNLCRCCGYSSITTAIRRASNGTAVTSLGGEE